MDENQIEELENKLEKRTKSKAISFEELSAVFDKWLLLPDKNVLKIVMAGLVAHQFDSDPLWIFLVAPPSGSKTEIISSLADIPLIYFLSDLTTHTLASGMTGKGGYDPSLLTKLKSNILLMKDFTTVLSMRSEDRLIILSQLREVYDGRFSKEFGTGKRVDWEGRLTLITGVTPIVDTHYSIFQVMGERFLMYRVPQAHDLEVAEKALSTYGQEEKMRSELKNAMYNFYSSLKIPKINKIKLPFDILKALSALASFIVRGRSGIVRDPYKRDLIYIPQPEAPSRFAKQLGSLIKALAVLDGRDEVSWKDYFLVLKVAFDAIPRNRMIHFMALCAEPFTLSTSKVAEKTDYSPGGSKLLLEDLTALGLIIVKREGQGVPNEWRISDSSYEAFKKILPSGDGMIEVLGADSEYLPLIREMIEGKPADYIPVEERSLDEKLHEF